MTTPHLHVLGIAPGDSSAWCLLTVPRLSIFGCEPSSILDRDYGEFHGTEESQATEIARLAREIQGLDYKTGPAVITGSYDIDLESLRIGAMIGLLHFQGKLADSTITFQGRTVARETVTDKQLKRLHYWTGSPNINDAHRHAITALRQAKADPEFAHKLWPYPPDGNS